MAKKNLFPICGTSLTVLGRETNRDDEELVHDDHRIPNVDLYDAFWLNGIGYRAYNDDPSNSNPGQVFYVNYNTNSAQTLIDSENFLSEEDVSISSLTSVVVQDRWLSSGPEVLFFEELRKQYRFLGHIFNRELDPGTVLTMGVKSLIGTNEELVVDGILGFNDLAPGRLNNIELSAGKWTTIMVTEKVVSFEYPYYKYVILGSNNWY
tara:strand:+ start:216 stop:839 length:624 start_codon:yes stop_codon:yes gene_type:complete